MLLGGFVSAAGGLDQALMRAEENEFDVAMFFIGSPQSWNLPELNVEQVERYKEALKTSRVKKTYAHALYLANLATPDATLFQRSIQGLTRTMQNGEKIGLGGVIFHLGSHKSTSTEEGLKRVAQGMLAILENSPGETHLIMENSVAQKDKVGGNFEELAFVLRELNHHPRATICMDTCHAFASGYNYTDPTSLKQLFTEIESTITFERLECLHVNDSQGELNSHIDRHANYGEGLITPDGFRKLLLDPHIKDKPFIMEIPGLNDKGPSIADKKALEAILGS